jgi:hypothetical protein
MTTPVQLKIYEVHYTIIPSTRKSAGSSCTLRAQLFHSGNKTIAFLCIPQFQNEKQIYGLHCIPQISRAKLELSQFRDEIKLSFYSTVPE